MKEEKTQMELDILNPKTEEEQAEFFRLSFSRYGGDWEKVAAEARLIFERPVRCWPSKKIVVEYKGKRRYYPARNDDSEICRSLVDASDTLMYEIKAGGKF